MAAALRASQSDASQARSPSTSKCADLSLGLQGGTTFTQDRSAEVTGMAASAQASGSVDFVLPAGKIPAELQRLVRSVKPGGPQAGAFGASAPDQNLILAAFPSSVKHRLLRKLELEEKSPVAESHYTQPFRVRLGTFGA